ncbi:restriction endonuclease subunit S [Aliarcobacter cryaerophilus]|uniref:restriction endonuclease subunit S n=1 Tax=Aliarcobacter cryaerophilus TaxID=28198 RepID=UPI00112F14F4|nr:restriction endonuclease subunit S [Aliarcobacter cryaerophilus]
MNDWQKVKIGDFLFERKGRYKPNDEQIANLPRIEKIDFGGNFHIGNKDSKTDMILIKDGDLVISGINVAKGAMGIYSGEDVTATIHYSSYTFDSNKINVEYFKRFLKSSEFIELLNEQVKGGIKTEIKPKHILPLEIQLPDINTQAQIVQHFENIEDDIADVTQEVLKQQSLLKQLKQTILQEAIEGKLTAKWRAKNPDIGTAKELLEQIKTEKEKLVKEKKIKQGKKQIANEIEDLDIEIPDSWLLIDLDDITQYITDGTHQTPRYVENGRMFLSAQNVKPFKFMPEIYRCVSEEDYQKYIANRQTEKGDLLLGRVGAGIGETAVVDQDLEFAIYVSLGLVKTFKQFTNPEYLATVFNSPYGVRYAKGNISSGGGSAGNFNLGRIRSFPIPFPPLEEQKEIVATIEKLFTICDELESEINQNKFTVDNLMATVLKEAFETKENIHEYKA